MPSVRYGLSWLTRPAELADQLSVIRAAVYTRTAWVGAPCGRPAASEGAAQAIITTAAATMSKPARPVSHVAFACSLLTMAVMSPPAYWYDQLRSACLAPRRLAVTRPTPLLSTSGHARLRSRRAAAVPGELFRR
jgi:hypothetical protein